MKKGPSTSGKLRRLNHATPVLARRELLAHGYRLAFTPPDAPAEKWIKKGAPALTVAREERPRSSVVHIVDYPDPVDEPPASVPRESRDPKPPEAGGRFDNLELPLYLVMFALSAFLAVIRNLPVAHP